MWLLPLDTMEMSPTKVNQTHVHVHTLKFLDSTPTFRISQHTKIIGWGFSCLEVTRPEAVSAPASPPRSERMNISPIRADQLH